MRISILLRSNGAALACGDYFRGQCNIHSLDGYLTYMQLAGVNVPIIRLRTDGVAVACGLCYFGPCIILTLDGQRTQSVQCNPRALTGQITCTQVAEGTQHIFPWRSDGSGLASGGNVFGQRIIPALVGTLTCTQVIVRYVGTLLVRSDSSAVAFGLRYFGLCNIHA